jgi:hypothetical protein
VGLRPHPGKSQQLGNLRCGLGTVRSIRDDWEKSVKEAKVRIGMYSHLRRRRRRRRRRDTQVAIYTYPIRWVLGLTDRK